MTHSLFSLSSQMRVLCALALVLVIALAVNWAVALP